MRIALITETELPEPDFDERPLVEAFAAEGHEAIPVAWGARSLRDFDGALLRSTWRYFERPEEFRGWLGRAASETVLMNPLALVLWNLHKGYLAKLAERGIATVPTAIVVHGAQEVSGHALAGDCVVKPAVSCGSWRTRRFRGDRAAAAAFVLELARDGDVLVQPYVDDVDQRGERSLVVVGGRVTHAMRKSPRFAGQAEHVTGPHPVEVDEAALAAAALAVLPEAPLYARVDMARDAGGRPQLMELELVEPSLFFAAQPEAALRLVDVVVAHVALASR